MKVIRALLVTGLLAVTGCSSSAAPSFPTAPTSAGLSSAAGSPSPAGSSSPAGGFGGTDLAWIEINLAMDEQLLPLLDEAARRSADPEVRALATRVKAFTEAELAVLRDLHARAGLPSVNPHKGMPMPGMVEPEDVTAAAALSGAAFDRHVVELVKGHLEQSRRLAQSEDKSGIEPQTRALASQVLSTRQEALSTLQKAL